MNVTLKDRSLGELFSDLSTQTVDLIRQEVRLAKSEVGEKLSSVGRHAIMIGAAAAFALTAVVAFAAAIGLWLVAIGVQPWLAALITAGGMLVVAWVLGQSGISAMRASVAPVETIRSLKETGQWLKNEIK